MEEEEKEFEKLFDTILVISQEFVDEMLKTFSEDEFMEWLEFDDNLINNYKFLKDRLLELELYEFIILLDKRIKDINEKSS